MLLGHILVNYFGKFFMKKWKTDKKVGNFFDFL